MNPTVRIRFLLGCALLAAALLPRPALSVDPILLERPYTPIIHDASAEAEQAIKKFSIPAGFEIEVFASEPMLANPVAFCVDNQGKFYVAETFRLHAGVTDMRNHKKWLDDDLACRTVQDRIAAMRKNLKFDFIFYALHTDRVQLIEDRDDDGKADHASIFAEGFSKTEDGIGAGVLADRGNVYYTCIPDLWLLRDTKGVGKADVRKSLSTGYGVHINFLGHDLHGLRKGPDGRIYFSIGDRGTHVQTEKGLIDYPDAGAVFRCEPDGSNLEIYHRGLRNPQELTFDDYGNLFTGDNNSDAGDKARWVYCVEGGDSGWQIGYQWIQKPVMRGPWNAESMWYPQWKGQAAFLLPPIENIAAGPSGTTHNPGTGMPEAYKDHFFLCDFRGAAMTSLIHSFALKPKGATFEMIDRQDFLKGALPTDVEFGVEGGIYFSDWIQGWEDTGKGRIYHIFNREVDQSPIVRETKRLLAEGMEKHSNDELAKLLEHPDQRVRLEAQWALADRGNEGLNTLGGIAYSSGSQLARIHAIWGIGQVARHSKSPDKAATLNKEDSNKLLQTVIAMPAVLQQKLAAGIQGKTPIEDNIQQALGDILSKQLSQQFSAPSFLSRAVLRTLVEDPDAEIRAQAVKALGECDPSTEIDSEPALIALLKDASPRPRFFAATALGKLGTEKSINPLLEMLRNNLDDDPYIRHAAVMALVGINKPELLLAKANDESPAVRMGILLALRRMKNPEIGRYLKDSDPRLVVEAARAINDVPIEGAFPALAALATTAKDITFPKELGIDPNALTLRILNANYRLGNLDQARAVAQLASLDQLGENPRLEALEELGLWANPEVRDRVIGVWRPLPKRDGETPRAALQRVIADLIKNDSSKIAQSASQLAGQYRIAEAAPALYSLLGDKTKLPDSRVQALKSLGALKDQRLSEAIVLARNDQEPALRTEGNAQLAKLDSAQAVRIMDTALEKGSVLERQGALNAIAEITDPRVDDLLGKYLDRLTARDLAPEIELELLEAAQKRSSDAIKQKLVRYQNAFKTDDPLAGYHESLFGGQAERGEHIFFEKVEAQCQKCHTVKGKGGGEVGPELTTIGSRKPREYILTSIVHPNLDIAEGFENVTIVTDDGKESTGRVVKEDAQQLLLEIPVQEEGEEFVEGDGEPAKPDTASTNVTKAARTPPEKSAENSGRKPGEKQTEASITAAQPPKVISATIEKAHIKSRKHNLSSMPEDLIQNLSKSELRDLVEYLFSLK